ncbi:hypothetical protein FH972_012654 [Carpinus fangiana]|uniref:DUF5110 domain-containing protein n=1 Tax=Carpinus fangiana TaxID=176857 RepID=A0A5N6R4N7_9ROSI|nr:hypothetical protein FH972_012654 [Carpinus fangiana]
MHFGESWGKDLLLAGNPLGYNSDTQHGSFERGIVECAAGVAVVGAEFQQGKELSTQGKMTCLFDASDKGDGKCFGKWQMKSMEADMLEGERGGFGPNCTPVFVGWSKSGKRAMFLQMGILACRVLICWGSRWRCFWLQQLRLLTSPELVMLLVTAFERSLPVGFGSVVAHTWSVVAQMSPVGSGSIVSLPEVMVEGFWFDGYALTVVSKPPIPPAPKPLKFYNRKLKDSGFAKMDPSLAVIDNLRVMGALSVLVVRDDGDDKEDGDFHLATLDWVLFFFVWRISVLWWGSRVRGRSIRQLALLTAIEEDDSWEVKGKAEGVLFEDVGDGYEFTKGEYLLTNFVAELHSSVVTVRVSKTEGLWKRQKRRLHVQLLLGGGAMLDMWGVDGEVLQIMMPSEEEVNKLVSTTEKHYRTSLESAKQIPDVEEVSGQKGVETFKDSY